MTERLTDTIAGLVRPDQLERLGTALAATPAQTSAATQSSIAALIEGLAELAAPAGGTTRVGRLLDQEGITGVDRLDEALERGDDAAGLELADEILGSRAGAVAAGIASTAGLDDPEGARRALGFLAPVVVSSVARRQRDESLSAASVGALLIAERDSLAAADEADAPAAELPAEAEAQLAAKALEATRDEAARHEDDERTRRKYVWPLVAAFAIAGAILAVVLALTLGGGDDAPAPPPAEPAPAEAASEPSEPPPAEEPELPVDIVTVAEADGDFTIFLGALETAGLDTVLRGDGPYTLLAPTDAAFAALPDGALDAILADAPRLEELLTTHVIEGTHSKASLAERDEITTQDGRRLPIDVDGSDLSISGATIVKPDQRAQNGVLHGTDALILPAGFELVPAPPVTVVDVAVESGFSTLVEALAAANLTQTLGGEGPFTLFAPSDEAFAALPDGALDEILGDPAAAEQLLTAHITGGIHDAADLAGRPDLTMITGQVLQITSDDTGLAIGGSRIAVSDIGADNGIIHVVESVILPEGLALGAENDAIDALDASGQFTSFLAAVETAGLTDELRSPGPLTILAPTDEAFAALPESVTASLADDPALLGQLVANHYGNVSLEPETMAEDGVFAAASGELVGVVSDGELIWVGGARLSESLESGNAAIHVIDRVIIPSGLETGEGTVNELLSLDPVRFEVASSELTPAGERVVARAAAYLITNPVDVEIGGHTDSDGEDEANQALSQDRADTVLASLVDAGVDAGRLSAVGYGASRPVASNETERGKARNRRIEFSIVG